MEDELACKLILEPYFEAGRDLFVKWSKDNGFPLKVKKVQLECLAEMHDTPRHYGGCREDGLVIAIAPQAVSLPEETVAAIIQHEFGHAMDFLFPSRFFYDGEDVTVLEDSEDDRTRVARMRQWEARDLDTVEFTADGIAELVTGNRIGYLGPCLLQSLNKGEPRPYGLR